jgi:hypothetical protein
MFIGPPKVGNYMRLLFYTQEDFCFASVFHASLTVNKGYFPESNNWLAVVTET